MRSFLVRQAIAALGLSCLAIFLAGCGSGGGDAPEKGKDTAPATQHGTPTAAPTVAPTAAQTPAPTLAATPEPTEPAAETPAPTIAPTPSTPPVWHGAHTVCRWQNNNTRSSLDSENAACDDVNKGLLVASTVIDRQPGNALGAGETCKIAVESFIESACKGDQKEMVNQNDTDATCIVREWDHGAYKVSTMEVSCNTDTKEKDLAYNYTTFGTIAYGDDDNCATTLKGWTEGQVDENRASCSETANDADVDAFATITDGVDTFARERLSADQSTHDMFGGMALLLGIGGVVTGAGAFACHMVVKRRSRARDMFPSNAVEMSQASGDAA